VARALQVEENAAACDLQVKELAVARAFQAGTIQPPLGTAPRITHIHPTYLVGVKGWAESQVLWCNAHNVRVGVQMAKLAALQLVQSVGARSAAKGPTHLEVGAPPPLGFPHTMLNVKRVKDNMRLAFIEKFFTNREIGTNVQTKYLRFKGMSYESESYLCDISCVQLWKALARFWCDNMQLEVVLGAWKGVPYAERLCRGCDLGKVKDEIHLLLICSNTQKVKEHFCSALPLTHTNILTKLM
jgi:hypothetical protein